MSKTKYKARDSWIPQSWRYNGSGYQENKKKKIERKQKYKKGYKDEY